MENFAYIASIWALPVLIAITFHEAAHAWVAWRLGDPTAKLLGRVTFNPIRHVDPFGTVILPAMLVFMGSSFLFGWAKPVPVDFSRLRNPRRDMVLVAAAGPGVNLALAFASVLLLHFIPLLPETASEWARLNLINSVLLNLILAVFNMIPLPPLDGGRVAVGLLPPHLAMPLARLERYGFMIILAVFFFGPTLGRMVGLEFDLFHWLVRAPVEFLFKTMVMLAGLE